MAYTKIHPIKTTLEKAIAYITNPEKTEQNVLVSSFACSENTAYMEMEKTREKFNYTGENLAYHCIQSFKPGEVTAEQAHQIGIQTADELLKGKYEYVISTHVDRGHIHNHIIINAVNFENGLSFSTEHDRKKNPAWKQLRKISDEICIENKLSVIELPEKGYGKCYYEWLQDQQNNSYKGKLKNAIDKCIINSESFEDFLRKMQSDMGYEYKMRGNSLSFRAAEQDRFTRCSRRNFGWYYEPEQIQKRIERQVNKRHSPVSKDTGFYTVQNDDAVGLKHWAALKNMQEASRLLNELSEYGLGSMAELETKIVEQYDLKFDVTDKLNKFESDIRTQRELLKMLNTYWDTKAVHDSFLKAKSKDKFEKEHHRELSVYKTTKEWLKERYNTTLPNRAVLEVQIAEKESEREAILENYHDIKKTISSLENIKEKMDKYLEMEQVEVHKNKKKEI